MTLSSRLAAASLLAVLIASPPGAAAEPQPPAQEPTVEPAAVAAELGRLRSGRSSLVDERFRMQSRLEAMATEVEHSDPEALPVYEAMSREAERGLKHLDTRIAETDALTLELENELARRRGDLQALQDRLDRELDGPSLGEGETRGHPRRGRSEPTACAVSSRPDQRTSPA